MKKIITSIVFLSFYLYSHSQQGVKILTPEASELAKYVEIPVGYFSGVPQVNLPLYEIVDGDIKIPITLNYHAVGHKVNEESSIVGLGWSLNVGGEIILVKRGGGNKGSDTVVEDFDENIPMPTSNDDMNPHYHMLEAYRDGRYLAENGEHENYFCDNWLGYNFKEIDGERDLYIFNFHNYTGKFMFVRKWENNSIKIVPEVIDRQNIKFKKITASTNNSSHAYGGKYIFEAIAEDGFIYKFGISDYSRSIIKKVYKQGTQIDGGVYPDVVSSYKLTSIQSPVSNKIVRFNYLTPTERSLHSPSYDYLLKMRKYSNLPTSLSEWHDSYTQYSYTESQNKYLEQIIFSGGRVNFYYSDRLDIYNGKKLDSIIVRNNNNTIIKKIYFNTLLAKEQNYFKSPTSGDPYPQSNNKSTLFSEIKSCSDKRLKLTDITIGSEIYQFKYNEDIMLPAKTSLSMDYWGFYNGASNSTLLPKPMYLQYYASYVPPELGNVTGSDRIPNANYIQANILKDITYPTKGKSTFLYEPHSFKSGSSVAYINITALDNNDFTPGPPLPVVEFEIKSSQTVTGRFWLQRNIPMSSYPVPLGKAYVAIQEYKNNTYQNVKPYQNGIYTECLWDMNKEFNTYISTGKMPEGAEIGLDGFQFHDNFSIILYPGKYRLVSYYSDEYGFNVKNKATISLEYLSPDGSQKEMIGGGVRIKEIRDENKDGSIITRKFSYEDGINLSIPKFIKEEKLPPASTLEFCPNSGITSTVFVQMYDGYVFPGFLQGYDLSSNNVYSFSNSANGSLVGYKKVTVQYSDAENGKSEYYYNISNPSINSISAPSGIPDVNKIDLGLLIREKHYKSMYKNIYMPIKEIIYDYNTIYDRFVQWNWIAEERPYYAVKQSDGAMETIPSWLMTTDDVIHLYPVVFGKKLLDSKTETLYSSDSPHITYKTSYLYNKDGHLKAESIDNSSGKKFVTEYRYPNDYTSINASNEWIKNMKNANALIYPIEMVKRMDDKVIGATYNEYKSPNGLVLSESYQADLSSPLTSFNFSNEFSGNKDSHYSLDVSYKYDNKGNIIQILPKNNLPVAYYWPTINTQNPVAKIEGILYSEIETIPSFISKLNDIQKYNKILDDNSKKELYSLNVEIRKLCTPKAQVYTYTYEPLVGITSITDPMCITTYYGYDNYGRLIEIYIYKDNLVSPANKQILQSYQYHYKN